MPTSGEVQFQLPGAAATDPNQLGLFEADEVPAADPTQTHLGHEPRHRRLTRQNAAESTQILTRTLMPRSPGNVRIPLFLPRVTTRWERDPFNLASVNLTDVEALGRQFAKDEAPTFCSSRSTPNATTQGRAKVVIHDAVLLGRRLAGRHPLRRHRDRPRAATSSHGRHRHERSRAERRPGHRSRIHGRCRRHRGHAVARRTRQARHRPPGRVDQLQADVQPRTRGQGGRAPAGGPIRRTSSKPGPRRTGTSSPAAPSSPATTPTRAGRSRSTRSTPSTRTPPSSDSPSLFEASGDVRAWIRINDTVPLRIPYHVSAIQRQYEPDFIVIDGQGTYWIVEGKADSEMTSNTVIAKRDAARDWVKPSTRPSRCTTSGPTS